MRENYIYMQTKEAVTVLAAKAGKFVTRGEKKKIRLQAVH